MITALSVLSLLPGLINAVEGLFKAFPGSGSVKKSSVLTSLNTIITAANTLGAKIDAAFVNSTAGQIIDDYVAVQNALGTPGFSAAQTQAEGAQGA